MEDLQETLDGKKPWFPVEIFPHTIPVRQETIDFPMTYGFCPTMWGPRTIANLVYEWLNYGLLHL